LRVPHDVALIGYDDIDLAADARVPLTSVRQPTYQLGRAAMELLREEIDQEPGHKHRTILFQPELVVRESTG
jgi:LacI family transcriptional regulator